MAEATDIDGGEAVELAIGGKLFGGWTSIAISIDLDAGASSFELGVTKRDPIRDEEFPIEADSACEVRIGGELVITGWVDRLGSSLDAESHAITVSGRSRAGDLVDCSAVAKPGSWRGRKLEEVAAELARPFGINVTAKVSTAPAFKLFALQPGETVWEAIARMCQHRGLLAVSTPAGDVEIVTAKGIGPAVGIVQGVHPFSIDGGHDVTERFGRYILKGQSAADEEVNGKQASALKAEATDPAVKRYRPLIIVAEEQATAASLKRRAEWEATVRAAKAQEATIALPGWRRSDGALWRPMHLVDLDAPAAWISAEMMAAGVAFIVDDRGRRVELRLARPEAYSQLPVPEDAEASKIAKKETT
jgi:prophage tail gpP-like protein